MEAKSSVSLGYNVSPTAGNTTGHKKTPEQIEACRVKQTDVRPSEATRKIMSENMIARMAEPGVGSTLAVRQRAGRNPLRQSEED